MLLVTSILLLLGISVTPALYCRKVVNPLLTFSGVWFVAFLLYQMDVSFLHLFKPIEAGVKWLFSLGFLSFTTGSLTAILRKTKVKISAPIRIDRQQLRFIRRSARILFPLLVGGTIARLIILTGKYGNPITNLPHIRADFSMGLITYPFYLNFFPMLFGYLLALNLGVLAVLERGIRAKFFVLALVVTMSLMDISVGTRIWSFNLFLFLVSVVLVTYNVILGRRILLKQLVVGLGCIALFAAFITIPLYLRSEGKYSFNKCLALLTTGYVVGDISSTGYFVEHPLPRDMPGYYTFGGILKLADDVLKPLGAGFLTPKNPMDYIADVGPLWGWNTSTDLAYYYSDFGVMGAIVPLYLLGFISSYFFLKAITYKRFLDTQLLAVTFSMILLSPRGIHSEGRFFWILLLVLLLQQKVLNKISGRRTAAHPAPERANYQTEELDSVK